MTKVEFGSFLSPSLLYSNRKFGRDDSKSEDRYLDLNDDGLLSVGLYPSSKFERHLMVCCASKPFVDCDNELHPPTPPPAFDSEKMDRYLRDCVGWSGNLNVADSDELCTSDIVQFAFPEPPLDVSFDSVAYSADPNNSNTSESVFLSDHQSQFDSSNEASCSKFVVCDENVLFDNRSFVQRNAKIVDMPYGSQEKCLIPNTTANSMIQLASSNYNYLMQLPIRPVDEAHFQNRFNHCRNFTLNESLSAHDYLAEIFELFETRRRGFPVIFVENLPNNFNEEKLLNLIVMFVKVDEVDEVVVLPPFNVLISLGDAESKGKVRLRHYFAAKRLVKCLNGTILDGYTDMLHGRLIEPITMS